MIPNSFFLIQVAYNDEATGLKTVIKKFFALAFLKADRTIEQIDNGEDSDLIQVLNGLCDELDSLVGERISEVDVDDFLQYFGQRWVGQAHRWNVHNIGKNRTNNHMEGWHSHMNKRIKQGSNIWKFILAIKAEQTSKELEMNQMNNDAIIVPLTKKQKKKERKLASLKVRYNNATLSPHEYNIRVSNYMGF